MILPLFPFDDFDFSICEEQFCFCLHPEWLSMRHYVFILQCFDIVLVIVPVLLLIGMKDGQQIRFSAEGDQEPGVEPGDIIVVLDEQKHPLFKRRGNDLFIDFELDLVDALCGFQKTIKTLDERTLLVTSLPGLLCFIVVTFLWNHSKKWLMNFVVI